MSAIGIVENGKFKQYADSTPNIFSFRMNNVAVTNGYVEYTDSRILETTNVVISNLYDSIVKNYFYTIQCSAGKIVVYIRTPTGIKPDDGTNFSFSVICMND